MQQTPDTIFRLIEDLQSNEEFLHSQAAFALGMIGEPAVGELVELLKHDQADVRMRAAWALGIMGAAALPTLLSLTEGDDQRLRVEAIRILGVVGEARALKQLLMGLVDPDPHIAARSARAIGRIGDPRAYHALITTLQHPVADVRYEACRSLADLHISDAEPYLRRLADNDEDETSWGASVAEMAKIAASEVQSQHHMSLEEEFERITRIVQSYSEESRPVDDPLDERNERDELG
jgi:HEAT repeat protein